MTDVSPVDLAAAPPGGLEEEGHEPALPVEKPYDPARDREHARGDIAKRLLWCLIGVVAVASLTGLAAARACWVTPGSCPATIAMLEPVTQILGLIFAPLVGLVGAATGFYFGEKSNR